MKKSVLLKLTTKMQEGYSYELVAPSGKNFDKRFLPLSPKQMLTLAVFGGRYMREGTK